MAKLVLPVGPPACGKSTLVKKLLGVEFIVPDAVVSPDRFRTWMTGAVGNQHRNKEVFQVANAIAKTRLEEGLDVYFDATNLLPSDLSPLKQVARLVKAETFVVVFETSEEECLERNAARWNPVPDDAMQRMFDRFRKFNPADHKDSRVMSDQEFLAYVLRRAVEFRAG